MKPRETATRPRLWIVGAMALVFFGVHCAGHIRRGDLHNLLWLSNVATLVLAAACLAGSARVAALALLWLSLSAFLWVLDVTAAGAPLDTAVLTHLGSFVLAAVAVGHLGVPPGTWWRAAAGLAALVGLCRLVTDRRQNVNLSFSVPQGWVDRLPSHGVYLGLLLALGTALFFVVERFARWRLRPMALR
jgi:hypothetical protein